MRIKINDIKVNQGRREIKPRCVEELIRSITAVGLLNPITIDQKSTLIAGLHRLEAARQLGWTEIECTICRADSLQAELAEIDENFVRSGLSHRELSELLFRRKEIYETLHPETKRGMRNGQTSKNEDSSLLEAKSFAQDTSEKLGVSKRTVEQLVQTARDLTPEVKQILHDSDRKITKGDALKLARLPSDQQKDAAIRLTSGTSGRKSESHMAELIAFSQEAARKDENPDELRTDFVNCAKMFVNKIKSFQKYSQTFADMSPLQITIVFDSIIAVNQAMRGFSQNIKELNLKKENRGDKA